MFYMKRLSLIITFVLVFTLLFSFCAFAEPDEGSEGQSTPAEQVDPTSAPEPTYAPEPEPTQAPAPTPDPTPAPTPTSEPSHPNNKTQTASAKNTDNTLAQLTVTGKTESGETVAITLEPAFKADVREYSISVPFEVVRLEIGAKASNSKARVNIPSGYLKLDLGANKSYIYVTAENGSRRTYLINTVRNEQQETTTELTTVEETTETTTQEVVTVEATTELTTAPVAQPKGMNTYTKLGFAFVAAGVFFLICSVIMFVKRKNNSEEIY